MGDNLGGVVYALGGTGTTRDRDLERLDQDNYLDPAGPVVRANSNKETVEQLHTHLLAAAEDYGAALPSARASTGTAGPAADADDAGALLVGTAAAQRRKRRRKVRKNAVQSIGRPFARVLEESGLLEGGARAAPAPNWLSCAARAPVRPRRWFCAMCGAPGVYQCPVCRARTCSRRCYDAHREVRCLKSVR